MYSSAAPVAGHRAWRAIRLLSSAADARLVPGCPAAEQIA